MSSDYQATITLRAEASELVVTLDGVQQKMRQTGQSGEDLKRKTEGAGSGLQNFNNSAKSLIGPLTSITGGVMGLALNYVSLERAQLRADKAQTLAVDTHNRFLEAQRKVNDLVAAGLTGTDQYAKAVQQMTSLRDKDTQATEGASIAQERANVMFANFFENILPTGLSILGGITGVMQVVQGRSKDAAKEASGLSSAFSNMGSGGYLALGALGAVAIAIGLIATNTFGTRDRLNDLGKAFGDMVPASRPMLLALRELGDILGLTGNDAKVTAKDMDDAVKHMRDSVQREIPQITDAMHQMTLSTDPAVRAMGEIDIATTRAMANAATTTKRETNNIVADFMEMGQKFASGDIWGGIETGLKLVLVDLPNTIESFFGPIGIAVVSNVAKLGPLMVGGFHTYVIEPLGKFGAEVQTTLGNTFGPVAAWFQTNVTDKISVAYLNLTQVFKTYIEDPISKAFAGTAAWFEEHVAKPIRGFFDWLAANPLVKAITGGIGALTQGPQPAQAKPAAPAPTPPALPPAPPSAPTLSGRGTPQAPYGVTPQTLTDLGLGYHQAAYTLPQQQLVNPYATRPPPVTNARPADYSGLRAEEQKATDAALQLATAHGIKIPAAFATSSEAVRNFMKPMTEEEAKIRENYETSAGYLTQHKLMGDIDVNNAAQVIGAAKGYQDYTAVLVANTDATKKAGTQVAANAFILSDSDQRNALFTAGVYKQTIALQDMQKAHIENTGALATYESQLVSGEIQEAAYTDAVDAQKKAFADSIVAISATQGKIDELNRELATGIPQAVAYADGWQKVDEEYQKMITDTANLAGQIDNLDQKIASGEAIWKNYALGLEQGKLKFDALITSTVKGAGENETYTQRLTAAVNAMGPWPPLLEKTTKNMELMVSAAHGSAESLKALSDASVKFFDPIGKAAESFVGSIAKTFGDFTKKVKDPLSEIPKWIRQAMDPNILKEAEWRAKGEALVGAILPAFSETLVVGGANAAADFLTRIQDKFNEAHIDPTPIINDLQSGTREGVQRAIIELLKLGPAGSDAAKQLAERYGIDIKALEGKSAAELEKLKGQFGLGGTNAGNALGTNLVNAANKQIAAWEPIKLISGQIAKVTAGGGALGTLFPGTVGSTMVQPGTAKPGAAGTAPATAPAVQDPTAQLKAFQQQAQAIFNSITIMAQGAGTQISAQINIGVTGAIASLKGLVTQAQAIFNQIPIMAQGASTQISASMNVGVMGAIASLRGLVSQAQASFNQIPKMAQGAGVAISSQINVGVMGAISSLSGLLSKAQSVMNSIVASAGRANTAVAAVATAIARLPANKTVTITVNNSQALSAIRATQSAIDSLHGKSVTNTVTTVYKSVGGGGGGSYLVQHGHHGIVTEPTHFIAGEAGPELVDVTPLNKTKTLQGSVGSSIGGSGSKDVTIVVNVAGKEVWREMRKVVFEDISQY